MKSSSYARLLALALGIPLLLAQLAACGAGTTGGGTTTTRPRTKALLTYSGHTDRATAVAWSPYGKDVVSGSLDKTVQVWSATTGKTRLIYRGHTDAIVAVAWSPDSRYMKLVFENIASLLKNS
jgi:WD40 repeat protein